MYRKTYWAAAISLFAVLLAVGCQTAKKPEPAPKNQERNQAADVTTLMRAAEQDPYADGCVSCHKKEGDVDRSLPAYVKRIPGHPEVRDTTVNTCYGCHDPQKNFSLYKRFLRGVHKIHWGSDTFYGKQKGQCYSCHTVETNGVSGIKNYPQAGYREGAPNTKNGGAGAAAPKENTGSSKEGTQSTKKNGSVKQSEEQKKASPEDTGSTNQDELPVPTP